MNEPVTPTKSLAGPGQGFGDGPVKAVLLVNWRRQTALPDAGAAQLLDLQGQGEVPLAQLAGPFATLAEEALTQRECIQGREIEVTRRSGAAVKLCAFVQPLCANAREPFVLLALNEASVLRERERRLRHLDRLSNAGTLAASTAHEIKNALVASRTFFDLLLEKNQDAELANIVRREVARIDAMVSRMLRFAGPAKALQTQIHLHEVVEHSIRLVQPQATSKGVAIESSFGADPDTALGDETELEQAFVNLLLNALEALQPHGTIRVTTENVSESAGCQGSRQIRIMVQDTGDGIPAENMARLFEPFFTTKPNGTGLGLAVTHRIVQEHAGSISAASRPGEGTTFTVVLPVHSPAEASNDGRA